jgi:hypothetical protein
VKFGFDVITPHDPLLDTVGRFATGGSPSCVTGILFSAFDVMSQVILSTDHFTTSDSTGDKHFPERHTSCFPADTQKCQ